MFWILKHPKDLCARLAQAGSIVRRLVVGQGQALGVCRGFNPLFLDFCFLATMRWAFFLPPPKAFYHGIVPQHRPKATGSTDHGMKHLKQFTKTNTSLHFKLSRGFGQRDRKVTVWHIQSLGIHICIIQNPGNRRHIIRPRKICVYRSGICLLWKQRRRGDVSEVPTLHSLWHLNAWPQLPRLLGAAF